VFYEPSCLPLALFEYNTTSIFHYMKSGS